MHKHGACELCMRLHAILAWYAEPPTWLANTVTSLAAAGIDHLIAVDGAYALYPEAKAKSGFEQAETIQRVCDGAGMALTLHQPQTPYMGNEVEKRTLAFNLLNATAKPFEDWVVVIDADEIVSQPCNPHRLRESLATSKGHDTMSVQLWWREDPTDKYHELAMKMPLGTEGYQRQSRWFRVLPNMRVEGRHFGFIGDDSLGKPVGLRSDYPSTYQAMNVRVASMGRVESTVFRIEHLDRLRIIQRREAKQTYYATRDESRVERDERAK